jgi:hypothetical protein
MAGKIFINYRREESGHVASRLHDRLAQAFGRDNLFMDVDHIPLGGDFVTHLNNQVAACDAMLVIIGPNWLTAKDETGQRLLDQPDDFVAIEIAAALSRNIRVIPVLIAGARMPRANELPDALKPLALRQAAEIRHATFGRDAAVLVDRMRKSEAANNLTTSNRRYTELTKELPRAMRGRHKQRQPAARVPLNKQLSAAEMEDFAALHRDRMVVHDVTRRVAAEPIYDTVECSVFGPPAMPPDEAVLIQAFLHLLEQSERTRLLASTMDSSTTLKGTRSLEIEIKRGARVELCLAVNGLLIDEPVQSVVWQGQPVFCQFLVTVPAGTNGHSFFPVVRVSIDGALVGSIKFRISSDSSAANPQSRPLGDHARRYENAFVSYATKDRKEVLKRVQMLNAMKIKFFLDLLSLDPGDRWEKKLYETIPHCDLFLLFWSQAAKDSVWVNREVEYALNQQNQNQDGEPDIVPVILEQNVPPPHNLAALHFNDRIQYLVSLMP